MDSPTPALTIIQEALAKIDDRLGVLHARRVEIENEHHELHKRRGALSIFQGVSPAHRFTLIQGGRVVS